MGTYLLVFRVCEIQHMWHVKTIIKPIWIINLVIPMNGSANHAYMIVFPGPKLQCCSSAREPVLISPHSYMYHKGRFTNGHNCSLQWATNTMLAPKTSGKFHKTPHTWQEWDTKSASSYRLLQFAPLMLTNWSSDSCAKVQLHGFSVWMATFMGTSYYS